MEEVSGSSPRDSEGEEVAVKGVRGRQDASSPSSSGEVANIRKLVHRKGVEIKRKSTELSEVSGVSNKKRKKVQEDGSSDENVTRETAEGPLVDQSSSTAKSSEDQDSDLTKDVSGELQKKSDADESRSVSTTSPPTTTTAEADPHDSPEAKVSSDEDRKPSPVVAAVVTVAATARTERENQDVEAASPVVVAAAATTPEEAAREDPEGVSIVKDMVSQRKSQEDDDTDPILMDGWFNWLDDLLEYYEKHGHCQVRDAENHILYSWLKRQRIMFRKGKLEPEKLRILQLLKTNGFDKPAKEVGDKTAKSPRAPARTSLAGKQPAAKPAATEASALRGQGPASQAIQATAQGGENSGQQSQLLSGSDLPQARTVMPGAIASQPALGVSTFSDLLASLQASTGASQLMANQAYAAASATAAPASSRPQRQDPPARVASVGGWPQQDASASANVLQNVTHNSAIASLLAAIPAESLAGTLGSLTADSIGILGRQVPNLAQLQAELRQPRRSGFTDPLQALVLLLQQQQEQQQRQHQQRQQQMLLEELIREKLRRQPRDDEGPN